MLEVYWRQSRTPNCVTRVEVAGLKVLLDVLVKTRLGITRTLVFESLGVTSFFY